MGVKGPYSNYSGSRTWQVFALPDAGYGFRAYCELDEGSLSTMPHQARPEKIELHKSSRTCWWLSSRRDIKGFSSSKTRMSNLSGMWRGRWRRTTHFLALVCSNGKLWRRSGNWCPLPLGQSSGGCCACRQTRSFTAMLHPPEVVAKLMPLFTPRQQIGSSGRPSNAPVTPWLHCPAFCTTFST